MSQHRFTVYAIALLLCMTSHAQASEKITWIHKQFPPAHIIEDPYKGLGYTDAIQTYLIKNLPEYEHTFVEASIARVLELYKTDQNILYAALLKRPNRETYIAYSTPINLVLPIGVLVLKESYHKLKPYIDSQGDFLLDKAIADGKIRIGITQQRSYGESIDRSLKKRGEQSSIFISAKIDLAEQILPMMQNNRLDCTLGYPMEGQYYSRVNEVDSQILSIPIKGMPNYFFAYLGAPDNDWGHKMLSKINPLIKYFRTTPEFHKILEFWLDEKAIVRYRQYVKEAFK